MEKINVVIVALNEKFLQQALLSLNTAAANIVAIVVENDGNRSLEVGAAKVPLKSFAAVPDLASQSEKFIWLVCGCGNETGDLYGAKKFLVSCGVAEENIVNFEIASCISGEWIANLRHVEKYGADFFATGNDCTRRGLNFHCFPNPSGGVNLSDYNQDLRQSFLTAKYVFEHVAPGKIKFVLIGLAPYSLHCENADDFAARTRNLQYMLALDAPAQNNHDRLLKALVSDTVKNFVTSIKAEQADLSFDREKNTNVNLSAKALAHWDIDRKNLTENLRPAGAEKIFRILKDYVELCIAHGAKPVGVVFPFAPAAHDNCDTEILTRFRATIRQLEETTEFSCVDLFDMQLGYDSFCDMTHLNLRGTSFASSRLVLQLRDRKILPLEKFFGMNYDYFDLLSYLIPKDDYNALMSDIFKMSVEKLRGKEKLKIAFVTDNASMWCGDKLYNYFARDERFEPTIFLCPQRNRAQFKTVMDDFYHGVRQFKSRGLNVVAISDMNAAVEPQDVIFYLRPYMHHFPDALDSKRLTAETLLIYLPYSFQVARDFFEYHNPIFYLLWKIFFASPLNLKLLDGLCKCGMPRGIFSGYPKLDVFFEDNDKLRFDWKTTRPDSKKIIWAPHHSISNKVGIRFATFQWNYKFMYEFAKAHPEISWVLKPHPALLYSAVEENIFPSVAAFEEYLQAWNDLPNAQVYTGAYYQGLFATSDGMIHDCGSFIAEYQYTHKPMIYLTRDTQEFNEAAQKILNVSYKIDGRDLNGIAALIQKIFIDGEDPKRSEREKFFDENLNYRKQNGMSASEFIYRNIRDALKG